jgi:hypothetical protein
MPREFGVLACGLSQHQSFLLVPLSEQVWIKQDLQERVVLNLRLHGQSLALACTRALQNSRFRTVSVR